MYLPTLQPVQTSEIYISGDVTIHDSALIAPGVILHAAPGAKIIVRAGVSIGMGSILKAYQGTIEVKENGVLGAGSLIIGQSILGVNVCLGASVTIYNTSLEAMTIIPAGSVIGDPSRSLASTSGSERVIIKSTQEFSPPNSEAEFSQKNPPSPEPQETFCESEAVSPWDLENEEIEDAEFRTEIEKSNSPSSDKTPVVGQVYINKLLFTLFPEKQQSKT
jgi:carbon dioxide concentrating mechanism protein CcmN